MSCRESLEMPHLWKSLKEAASSSFLDQFLILGKMVNL